MKRFCSAALAAIVALMFLFSDVVAQTTTPAQQEAAIKALVKDRDALVAAVKALVKDRDTLFVEIAKLKSSGGTSAGISAADAEDIAKKVLFNHGVELNGKTLAGIKTRILALEKTKPLTAKEVADEIVKSHLSEIRGPQGPVGVGRDGKDAIAPPAPTADEVAKNLASQVVIPVATELVKNFKDQLPAGKDGQPGKDGTNGRDGVDGAPGRDGKDADPELGARALIFSAFTDAKKAYETKLLWNEGIVDGVFCQALVFEEKYLLDWLNKNIVNDDGSLDRPEAQKWLRKRLPQPLAKDIASRL